MEIIRSLPFSWVISAAIGIAASLTALMVWMILHPRRRRKKKAEVPANNNVPGRLRKDPYTGKVERELSQFVASLSSTIERLDQAIAACLDLSRSLSHGDFEHSEGICLVHTPPPDLNEIGGRINEMRDCGIDERDIARRLNLSSEQLKLYMHVGRKREKAVALN